MALGAMETDVPSHLGEATFYVRMMRFFMSVNVLLGLAMFIYTLVIEFPVQSRGGALLMILSLATLLVSIAMVPIAGVGKKLFIAFIMAVSLFLLVFQLVVGGVMAGKPYNFVKLMHSPSAALQAKIHRGGALILVAGIDEAIVLLLLTFRYLFGHKFGHYDPYAGEEGRARADNNLNALAQDRAAWEADRRAQKRAKMNVDRSLKNKYGQFAHNFARPASTTAGAGRGAGLAYTYNGSSSNLGAPGAAGGPGAGRGAPAGGVPGARR